MKLYPRQAEIVEQLKFRMENDPVVENRMYLSGEMGTGKTYMGADLAKYYNDKGYTVLIITPPLVRKKWLDLLGNDVITVGRTEKTKGLFKSNSKKMYYISMEDINTWINRHYVTKDDFSEKIVLICDEIHLFKLSKYEALQNLLSFMHEDSFGIFMTGTIMEGNVSDINNMITLTHPKLSETFTGHIELMIRDEFSQFIFNIWQHISTSIALEEIETLTHAVNEERQEVMPIEPIPLTKEEELFNGVISSALNEIMDNNRADYLSTTFLDNPNKPLVYKKRVMHTTKRIKGGAYVELGLPLSDIDLDDTSKYKALVDVIDKNKDDKVLVYVNELEIMKDLYEQLTNDDYDVFYLNGQVKSEEYSEYINENYKKHQIGIANPEHVNVGIDIHAEQLVWYQLMPDIDKMLQAQRRVCRLSSQYKSKVTLFVYDTPSDNQRAIDLSNALKYNSATYGMKQDDPLAELTGILLEGIS